MSGGNAQSLPGCDFSAHSAQKSTGHGTQISALASLWEPALPGLSRPPEGISTLRMVTESQPAPHPRVSIERSPC